ncbi:MAG: phosphopantothenoylcysteine decarboxylase [Planctomycetes bacterium]|nr:phosphopantothenoylcysteine decarboxylase [Planctomycetota bacterium]
MLNGREVLIGVSGGVAAYKTAALVSQLVQRGAGVSVVMTPAAEKFVGRATFAALTGRAVAIDSFEPSVFPLGAHIELAERAELFCVAPATANYLAQAATGLADDLLSTLTLSFAGPWLVAPAMNSDMWAKPAVQRNVEQVRRDGATLIDPEEGWLSCRRRGAGRMADPARILAAIEAVLKETPSRKK